MIERRLPASLVGALLIAAPLAGCGTSMLDASKVETEIENGLRQQLNLPAVDVKCPKQVEMKANENFDCPVTTGTKKGMVTVIQQDAQGNVRWKLKGEQIQP